MEQSLARKPDARRRRGPVPGGSGSRPSTSGVTLAAGAVSLVALTPLAYAKRRLGERMASRALHGDGALSRIGAASSLLALTALALYDALVWWQADGSRLIIAAMRPPKRGIPRHATGAGS